eukprot:Rhum_TRINITY_DN14095_c3_g1::Rhum_TRINITY_DN14095_c3_g1_i1::g.68864::m.68864
MVRDTDATVCRVVCHVSVADDEKLGVRWAGDCVGRMQAVWVDRSGCGSAAGITEGCYLAQVGSDPVHPGCTLESVQALFQRLAKAGGGEVTVEVPQRSQPRPIALSRQSSTGSLTGSGRRSAFAQKKKPSLRSLVGSASSLTSSFSDDGLGGSFSNGSFSDPTYHRLQKARSCELYLSLMDEMELDAAEVTLPPSERQQAGGAAAAAAAAAGSAGEGQAAGAADAGAASAPAEEEHRGSERSRLDPVTPALFIPSGFPKSSSDDDEYLARCSGQTCSSFGVQVASEGGDGDGVGGGGSEAGGDAATCLLSGSSSLGIPQVHIHSCLKQSCADEGRRRAKSDAVKRMSWAPEVISPTRPRMAKSFVTATVSSWDALE